MREERKKNKDEGEQEGRACNVVLRILKRKRNIKEDWRKEVREGRKTIKGGGRELINMTKKKDN